MIQPEGQPTKAMSDTLHIKRFSDHLRDGLTVAEVLAMDGPQATLEALKACVASHNDLAHHLEQEHDRNNQLEKMHHLVYKDLVRLQERIEELELRFNSNAHPHPKGENN